MTDPVITWHVELRTYDCDMLEVDVKASDPYAAVRAAKAEAESFPHTGEWFAEAVHYVDPDNDPDA